MRSAQKMTLVSEYVECGGMTGPFKLTSETVVEPYPLEEANEGGFHDSPPLPTALASRADRRRLQGTGR
jgi:hypothetical protein